MDGNIDELYSFSQNERNIKTLRKKNNYKRSINFIPSLLSIYKGYGLFIFIFEI